MMDTLLTISGTLGLLSTGFVIGDFMNRRRTEKELVEAGASLKVTLASIQAVHNQLVANASEIADRLGSVEMLVKTGINKR